MATSDDDDPWGFLDNAPARKKPAASDTSAAADADDDAVDAAAKPRPRITPRSIVPKLATPDSDDALNPTADSDRPSDAVTSPAPVVSPKPAASITPTATPAPKAQASEPATAKSGGYAGREIGELRGTMAAVPLKQRAWPMALALALVSIAGFLSEIVAGAAVVSAAGPQSMIIIYPLGGIGLLLLAIAQFTVIDGKARLPMIRKVALGYAAAFAVALALFAGSIVPVIAIAVVWLLADQLNFLLPLMIWSLAGDEFNVAEGRKIFGWIVTWTYLGQVLGLAISVFAAPALSAAGVPLPALLIVAPLICVFVAWWLPRKMRGSAAATGLARQEKLGESLSSAWSFISGISVWRAFLASSVLTFVAGMTIFISFMAGADELLTTDAADLQMLYGGVSLASFLICWGIQALFAEKLQDRIGIPGVLLVLPIATVVAGLVLVLGSFTGSLVLIGLGLAVWLIPRWSIDENARRAALSLVPDERRTRVSFFVDLGPVAIGLIAAGPIAAVGLLTGQLWLAPALAAVLAALAILPARRVLRDWDASLLNWRLRRRKRNRTLNLGDLLSEDDDGNDD